MKRLTASVCALATFFGTANQSFATVVAYSSGSNFITSPLVDPFPPVIIANGTANVSVFSTVVANGTSTDDPALLAQASASISVLGGTLLANGGGANGTKPRAGIELLDSSSLLLVSGTIEGAGSGVAVDRAGILITGNSLATILGGSIKADGTGTNSNVAGIDALGNSQVSILGGSISTAPLGGLELALFAANDARITIFGSGFNFPNGAIAPLSGTLTGQLQDGSSINWTFMRDSTASITIIAPVPEPSSFVLLAMGCCAFILKRSR